MPNDRANKWHGIQREGTEKTRKSPAAVSRVMSIFTLGKLCAFRVGLHTVQTEITSQINCSELLVALPCGDRVPILFHLANKQDELNSTFVSVRSDSAPLCLWLIILMCSPVLC